MRTVGNFRTNVCALITLAVIPAVSTTYPEQKTDVSSSPYWGGLAELVTAPNGPVAQID